MNLADLRHYLLANAGVAALIGQRFSPDGLSQGETLPAVAGYAIDNPRHGTLEGVQVAAVPRFQIDCYGATRDAADALAAAIDAALQTLHAACPTKIGSTNSVPVCDLEIEGPRHDRQPLPGSSDQYQYISSLDVRLWNS